MKSEHDLWLKLKKNWPYVHWQRIESLTGSGIPDANGCFGGYDFWLELKITHGKDRIYLRKFQIPWMLQRNRKGGNCFFLIENQDKIYFCLEPLHEELIINTGARQYIQIQNLKLALVYKAPYDWNKMFEEFMEVLNDRRTNT